MQKYSKINATDYVKDTLLALNDTQETLLSQNSGTAFPTTNLVVGMKCFRTDLNKAYTLKSIEPLAWVLTEDLNRDIYDAETFGGKAPSAFAHPTGDGNLHVPATEMSNNGKVLTAGRMPGDMSWQNPYSHPTGDGNLHVPATGTDNNGKVLTAGATEGSASWQNPLNTNITTTASTQGAISTYMNAPGLSGIILTQAAGLPAGTRTIASIIQSLVNLSHSHGTTTGVNTNCNCNCACNCYEGG